MTSKRPSATTKLSYAKRTRNDGPPPLDSTVIAAVAHLSEADAKKHLLGLLPQYPMLRT